MKGKQQPGYEIRFETNPRRVRVEFNGATVADSSRALVLHETRLAPAFYFPRDDVRFDLFEKSAQTTHCPFKGDASYWTLKVGGAVAENAAWSYDEPYDDAAPIRGHLSFYPGRVGAIYDGAEEAPHLEAVPSMHANSIAGWLLAEAWKETSEEALMERFCRCLQQAGVPVSRMTMIIPALHPQVFATVLVWRDDTGAKTIHEPHDVLHTPRFKDSPFALILRGAGGVRRRIGRADARLDFPVVRDLKAENATDYVAMPFRFSDGQLNVMSITSFAPGGFTTDHLGRVFEVLPGLARYFEVFAQRRTAVTLLKTYLGQRTGQRVLAGQVRHGDGEHIHSVIWFSDLRSSTMLSKSMARDAYLALLNRYFDCLAGAVIRSGGEVLRFIGDAVLAIFPITGADAREACRRAIEAARLSCDRVDETNRAHPGEEPIRFGIGLHLGDVTYGNIGVRERLEFTVIGASANEAARVESMCKALGKPVVISSAFAAAYGDKLTPLGRHELKDVEGSQELFTLP
jgi:adenylate cyclase